MPLTSYSKLFKIHQRLPGRTKPSTSFSTFPPELILNVFKSTQSFSAATNLSSVSRQLNAMWKLNIRSIGAAILGHMLEAPEEGLALVTALETAADDLHYRETPDLIKGPADQDTVLEAIARIEHVISNAKVALLVLNFYETNVITLDKDQPRRLNTKERVQFFKSYYLILFYAIHDSTRLLGPLSPNPFRRASPVIWWRGLRRMMLYLQNEDIQSGQISSSLFHNWQSPSSRLECLATCEEQARVQVALIDFSFKLRDLDSEVYWHQKPWAPFFYLLLIDNASKGIRYTGQRDI